MFLNRKKPTITKNAAANDPYAYATLAPARPRFVLPTPPAPDFDGIMRLPESSADPFQLAPQTALQPTPQPILQPTTLQPTAQTAAQTTAQPISQPTPRPATPYYPTQPTAQPQIKYVSTLRDLLGAIDLQVTQFTLAADIVTPQNIVINHDLTIDFNNHSIISEQATSDARVFDVRRGAVRFIGKGKIFAMGAGSTAIRISGARSAGMARYSTVLVERDIHLFAPEGTGLEISTNHNAAYGVVVDFFGEIIAHTGVRLHQDVTSLDTPLPQIHIQNGARIIADETNGAAISALGLGEWQISAAELYGGNALEISAGTFLLENPHCIGSAEAIKILPTTEAAKMYSAAEAAKVRPITEATNMLSAAAPITSLIIDGGAYASENNLAISGTATNLAKFVIRAGDFCGVQGIFSSDLMNIVKIEDGNFTTNLDEFWSNLAPLPVAVRPEPLVLEDTPAAPITPAAQTTPLASTAQATPITSVAPTITTTVQAAPITSAFQAAPLTSAFQAAPITPVAPTITTTAPTMPSTLDTPTESIMSDDELDELFYFNPSESRFVRPTINPCPEQNYPFIPWHQSARNSQCSPTNIAASSDPDESMYTLDPLDPDEAALAAAFSDYPASIAQASFSAPSATTTVNPFTFSATSNNSNANSSSTAATTNNNNSSSSSISYETITSYAYGPTPSLTPAPAPFVTTIDEQTPRPYTYRPAPHRPAPRAARPVAGKQTTPTSRQHTNVFSRLAMGFHAGFSAFRSANAV